MAISAQEDWTASTDVRNPANTQGDSHTDVTGVVDSLHQATFATPSDFLQSIKQDYGSLPQACPGSLTMLDLNTVIQTNSDPKLRAEALVTANHFADLQKLSATEHSGNKGYITENDIASALNLESGNLDEYKSGLQKMQNQQTIEAASVTSALTTMAFLTCKAPLVAGFFALGVLGVSVVEMSNFCFLQNRIDNAQKSSDQLKNSMSTWSEINGRK